MSFLAKRAVAVLALSGLAAVVATLLWPGDPAGEPLSGTHYVSLILVFLAALLVVVGAVLVVIVTVSGAWRVKDFNPNRYLDEMRKDS